MLAFQPCLASRRREIAERHGDDLVRLQGWISIRSYPLNSEMSRSSYLIRMSSAWCSQQGTFVMRPGLLSFSLQLGGGGGWRGIDSLAEMDGDLFRFISRGSTYPCWSLWPWFSSPQRWMLKMSTLPRSRLSTYTLLFYCKGTWNSSIQNRPTRDWQTFLWCKA